MDFINQKLDYNIECGYCDQGINGKDKQKLKSKGLFYLEFNTEFKPYCSRDLFSKGIIASGSNDYILRICRNCGHQERFDFELLTGKTLKEMKKEIKSW